MTQMQLLDIDTDGQLEHCLTFECNTPVNEAIIAAGHEPNGYFWESVVELVGEGITSDIELDSEANAFCAYGKVADLKKLKASMEPYLNDAEMIQRLIHKAKKSGFTFLD